MKRLTEIDSVQAYWNIDNTVNGAFEVTQKLGQLEDIEEELGVDLIDLLNHSTVKNILKRVIYNKPVAFYPSKKEDIGKKCISTKEELNDTKK